MSRVAICTDETVEVSRGEIVKYTITLSINPDQPGRPNNSAKFTFVSEHDHWILQSVKPISDPELGRPELMMFQRAKQLLCKYLDEDPEDVSLLTDELHFVPEDDDD